MSSEGAAAVEDQVVEAIESGGIGRAMEVAGIEDIYLLVRENCELCEALVREMEEQVDAGMVDVLDVGKSDRAIDMVASVDETVGIPSFIVETDDGEYVSIQ